MYLLIEEEIISKSKVTCPFYFITSKKKKK